jgi:hypothetical protein
MKKHILIYGLCGGVLIAVLKLVEYRFLVVDRLDHHADLGCDFEKENPEPTSGKSGDG